MHPKTRLTWILVLLAVGLTACGEEAATGNGEEQGAVETAKGEAAPGPSPTESLTPKDLGERVGALYLEAMKDLVALLEEKRDAASVRPEVEALKERIIPALVALGRQREALDDADRAAMDRVTRARIFGLPKDLFQSYSDLQQYYSKQDFPFGELLAEFNVITQYADFELLRKQLPEEAERLGIPP